MRTLGCRASARAPAFRRTCIPSKRPRAPPCVASARFPRAWPLTATAHCPGFHFLRRHDRRESNTARTCRRTRQSPRASRFLGPLHEPRPARSGWSACEHTQCMRQHWMPDRRRLRSRRSCMRRRRTCTRARAKHQVSRVHARLLEVAAVDLPHVEHFEVDLRLLRGVWLDGHRLIAAGVGAVERRLGEAAAGPPGPTNSGPSCPSPSFPVSPPSSSVVHVKPTSTSTVGAPSGTHVLQGVAGPWRRRGAGVAAAGARCCFQAAVAPGVTFHALHLPGLLASS